MTRTALQEAAGADRRIAPRGVTEEDDVAEKPTAPGCVHRLSHFDEIAERDVINGDALSEHPLLAPPAPPSDLCEIAGKITAAGRSRRNFRTSLKNTACTLPSTDGRAERECRSRPVHVVIAETRGYTRDCRWIAARPKSFARVGRRRLAAAGSCTM
jgi:hypothetical protein